MRILGITVTAMLYCVIVGFAVLLLAAVEFRSAGGVAFDTWRLNYDANQANQTLVEQQKKELYSVQEAQRNNNMKLLSLKPCFRLFDVNGVPNDKLIDKETAQLVQGYKAKQTSFNDLKGDVYCLVAGQAYVQNEKEMREMQDKAYSDEVSALEASLAASKQESTELAGHKDFVALSAMRKVWYQKPFYDSPYDLIVLLLVMVMGAIGGMVRLLRDYGSPQHADPAVKEYILIPLIGAVVAIGGYVLAKTGLLLLSSTQGETSLSPYMISLVGIVSGLLAKEVIEAIATRGRDMLKRDVQGEPQDRDQTDSVIPKAA